MAVISGTTSVHGVGTAGGIREDLSDVIFDLFPEDTWALTNLDRESAESTYTEWLAQELAAPSNTNIRIEGDEASYASLTAPARYASYLQISSKDFLVSDTLEAVNKAGRKSELVRGAMVKMRELKRDMETRIEQNGASTAGGAGTGRSTAGMESWIGGTASASVAGHVVLAGASASATTAAITSGAAGVAPTDGSTTVALTATGLNLALQGAWADGGDARVVLCSAKQKGVIDTFTGIATRFVDVDKSAQASIIGAANVYVSDFGKHQVVLSRYMRDQTVLCLDPDYWAVRYLRKPQKRKLAKTGDAEKNQIITEWALVARNWKANAKVVACA